MKRKEFFQIISFQVNIATETIDNIQDVIDKNYERVTGVHVICSDADQAGLINSRFDNFEIDNNKIFAKGHEAKLLNTGDQVSPRNRYYPIDEKGENSTFRAKYVDGGAAAAYPYTVSIYLRLANPSVSGKVVKKA